jgi:hypothetical protein
MYQGVTTSETNKFEEFFETTEVKIDLRYWRIPAHSEIFDSTGTRLHYTAHHSVQAVVNKSSFCEQHFVHLTHHLQVGIFVPLNIPSK